MSVRNNISQPTTMRIRYDMNFRFTEEEEIIDLITV